MTQLPPIERSNPMHGTLITLGCPRGHDLPVYLDDERMKKAEEAVLETGVPFERRGEAAALWLLDAIETGAIECPACKAEDEA